MWVSVKSLVGTHTSAIAQAEEDSESVAEWATLTLPSSELETYER